MPPQRRCFLPESWRGLVSRVSRGRKSTNFMMTYEKRSHDEVFPVRFAEDFSNGLFLPVKILTTVYYVGHQLPDRVRTPPFACRQRYKPRQCWRLGHELLGGSMNGICASTILQNRRPLAPMRESGRPAPLSIVWKSIVRRWEQNTGWKPMLLYAVACLPWVRRDSAPLTSKPLFHPDIYFYITFVAW